MTGSGHCREWRGGCKCNSACEAALLGLDIDASAAKPACSAAPANFPPKAVRSRCLK